MNTEDSPWRIVGQGLAGTCLAWCLWKRGASFQLIDRESGGSSRVAAGLINPVTGKNFEPSVRIEDFLPEASAFYQEIEAILGFQIWHPLPVLRLAATEKEWAKMQIKAAQPHVARWLGNGGEPLAPENWAGAYLVQGGGRLDTRAFLDGSREFFRKAGIYQQAEVSPDSPAGNRVWCEGAAGLIAGRFGTHRCAKGEILTLEASGWDESTIRVGAGGWLVPIGNGRFKAGATYDWDRLDESPTPEGRERVKEIATRLGGNSFEIIAHEAGVRPILRRSEPLIGPTGGGDWMFNALGSKGSLYAPGVAKRLATWLLDQKEPEAHLDFRRFNDC